VEPENLKGKFTMHAVNLNKKEQNADVHIAYEDLQTLHLVIQDVPEMVRPDFDIPEERVSELSDKINALHLEPGESTTITLSKYELNDLLGILNHACNEISKEYEESEWERINNANEAVLVIVQDFRL